jgi:hypothetical protein
MTLGDVTPCLNEALIAIREKAVREQLAVHVRNLNHLELQAAQYGLSVPIHLLNEMEHTREQIYHLTKELLRQEGILPVLEAISQGEPTDRMLQG